MNIKRLLDTNTDRFFKNTLDVISKRHSVITSNIANQDTPGYKAVRMDFKQELKKAAQDDMFSMSTTDSRHIGGVNDTSSNIQYMHRANETRPDGNDVDIDQEMTELAENQLFYNAVVQAMINLDGILANAVNEGRR